MGVKKHYIGDTVGIWTIASERTRSGRYQMTCPKGHTRAIMIPYAPDTPCTSCSPKGRGIRGARYVPGDKIKNFTLTNMVGSGYWHARCKCGYNTGIRTADVIYHGKGYCGACKVKVIRKRIFYKYSAIISATIIITLSLIFLLIRFVL